MSRRAAFAASLSSPLFFFPLSSSPLAISYKEIAVKAILGFVTEFRFGQKPELAALDII
jgi:hypothetical protein